LDKYEEKKTVESQYSVLNFEMLELFSKPQKLRMIQILIVEDEYIIALNLQENLESLGYTVIDIVDSAEAAIETANKLRPSLILMDIRLRGEMDGIQAAEQIWNNLQIPLIYLTGNSDENTVERATLTYPFGYILKPVRERELYVAIQTALNRYEREQFLDTVLRGMGDGVIVVNLQLRIKYLNPVAEALTQWQLKEAKDQMLNEVYQLIDEQTQLPVENSIISALQQETIFYQGDRILLVAKDGTKIPVADSAAPLKDINGVLTGAVIVFRDDTQRRLTQERKFAVERAKLLEIQIAELQRLKQLKEEFLIAISHEIRTPLSNMKMAILMLGNVLNEQGILQSEYPTIDRYFNSLKSECERELNLIDDLLNLRLIDAQVYPLDLTSIHLQEWLPRLVENFQGFAQSQQQILTVEIPADLPPVVTDSDILARIISELINNACKYSPSGEQIRVTTQLTSSISSITNEDTQFDEFIKHKIPVFQIKISNSGLEIPVEEQARIFEAFYQIPHRELGQKSGTGLGLALVKKLVEYLQGVIEVTSSQGWTNFTISLPLILSE